MHNALVVGTILFAGIGGFFFGLRADVAVIRRLGATLEQARGLIFRQALLIEDMQAQLELVAKIPAAAAALEEQAANPVLMGGKYGRDIVETHNA